MRSFIAIPLPSETKKQLAKVQSCLHSLDARITWVNPQIPHITFEFLGDIDKVEIPKVSAAIEKACQQVKPFELRLEGLKLIPNLHHPRVIAVSVDGDLETFWQLKNKIRQELETLGFRFEEEKSPHITLGRIKEKFAAQTKKHFLEIAKESRFNDFKSVNVREIVLMKSALTQTGPIYTPIAEIPLEIPLTRNL